MNPPSEAATSTCEVQGRPGAAVVVTVFDDVAAQTMGEAAGTLGELAELVQGTSRPSKDALPLLKPARFGELRSKQGSLRHNQNVTALTGIAVDYDGEQIEIDEVVEKLDKAGITALVYSSPSHRPGAPRWRVLCPFSVDLPPGDHQRMVARLNGLLGGILAGESFTLSQSYYFGSVAGNPQCQVEIVNGAQFLDGADELDEIAIGKKPNGKARARPNGVAHDGAAQPGGEAKSGEDPEADIDDIVAAWWRSEISST